MNKKSDIQPFTPNPYDTSFFETMSWTLFGTAKWKDTHNFTLIFHLKRVWLKIRRLSEKKYSTFKINKTIRGSLLFVYRKFHRGAYLETYWAEDAKLMEESIILVNKKEGS